MMMCHDTVNANHLYAYLIASFTSAAGPFGSGCSAFILFIHPTEQQLSGLILFLPVQIIFYVLCPFFYYYYC